MKEILEKGPVEYIFTNRENPSTHHFTFSNRTNTFTFNVGDDERGRKIIRDIPADVNYSDYFEKESEY
jgi:hypothetical protein